jgi:hypothetical protein
LRQKTVRERMRSEEIASIAAQTEIASTAKAFIAAIREAERLVLSEPDASAYKSLGDDDATWIWDRLVVTFDRDGRAYPRLTPKAPLTDS